MKGIPVPLELNYLNPESLDQDLGIACFVDVETTGLDPGHHEVLELAATLFAFRRDTGQIVGLIEEYIGLREPVGRIPSAATKIHGIKRKDVKSRRLHDARIQSILDRAEFIIAHNAAFDRAFVEPLYPVASRKCWLCSMDGLAGLIKGFILRAFRICCETMALSPPRPTAQTMTSGPPCFFFLKTMKTAKFISSNY